MLLDTLNALVASSSNSDFLNVTILQLLHQVYSNLTTRRLTCAELGCPHNVESTVCRALRFSWSPCRLFFGESHRFRWGELLDFWREESVGRQHNRLRIRHWSHLSKFSFCIRMLESWTSKICHQVEEAGTNFGLRAGPYQHFSFVFRFTCPSKKPIRRNNATETHSHVSFFCNSLTTQRRKGWYFLLTSFSFALGASCKGLSSCFNLSSS